MEEHGDRNGIIEMGENRVCRFTGWCRKTGYSLEYWEVFVTDQRLIFCRVGESFSSLLLKADMGAADRERVSKLSLSEIVEFSPHNFVVPAATLESVRLHKGSTAKKTILSIKWDGDEWTLFDVKHTSTYAEDLSCVTDMRESSAYPSVTFEVVEREGITDRIRNIVRSLY